MNLDAAFITAVVRLQTIGDAANNRLAGHMLVDKDAKAVFAFCTKFFLDYGTAPPPDMVEGKFPRFPWHTGELVWDALKDELRSRHLFNEINAALSKAARHQKDRDPRAAMEEINRLVLDHADLASGGTDLSWTQTVKERLERYNRLKDKEGVLGHTTPWESLDAVTLGVCPSQLIGIVARRKTGKTWVECIWAEHFHSNGLKVALFTNEMGAYDIMERLDSARAKVPFSDLRAARLQDHLYQKYLEAMGDLEKMQDLWIFTPGDGGTGISTVVSKIEQYRPDVTLIDGFYLMDDEIGAQAGWERLVNISRGLKKLANKKSHPIIVSAQLNKEGSVAYSSGLTQDCDWVLELKQSDDMRELNPPQMLAKLKVHRQGDLWERMLTWDLVNMDFSEITESGGRSSDDDEDSPY